MTSLRRETKRRCRFTFLEATDGGQDDMDAGRAVPAQPESRAGSASQRLGGRGMTAAPPAPSGARTETSSCRMCLPPSSPSCLVPSVFPNQMQTRSFSVTSQGVRRIKGIFSHSPQAVITHSPFHLSSPVVGGCLFWGYLPHLP